MTLLDFVRLTRANWRLIFVVASLGLVAAFLWTLTRPVTYASVATGQGSTSPATATRWRPRRPKT